MNTDQEFENNQCISCTSERGHEIENHLSTGSRHQKLTHLTCCRCLSQSYVPISPFPNLNLPSRCCPLWKGFEISSCTTPVEVQLQVIQSKSLQKANGAVCLKIDRNPHQKHPSRHDRKINPGRLLLALYESSCCYSNFSSASNLKTKHSWNNITVLSKNDI